MNTIRTVSESINTFSYFGRANQMYATNLIEREIVKTSVDVMLLNSNMCKHKVYLINSKFVETYYTEKIKILTSSIC